MLIICEYAHPHETECELQDRIERSNEFNN